MKRRGTAICGVSYREPLPSPNDAAGCRSVLCQLVSGCLGDGFGQSFRGKITEQIGDGKADPPSLLLRRGEQIPREADADDKSKVRPDARAHRRSPSDHARSIRSTTIFRRRLHRRCRRTPAAGQPLP